MIALEDQFALFREKSGNDKSRIPLEHYQVYEDGTVLWIHRLVFHWTMKRGHIDDWTSYDDRWCYATQELAEAALAAAPETVGALDAWDPPGWHRHPTTGRRRVNGDPSKETIAW